MSFAIKNIYFCCFLFCFMGKKIFLKRESGRESAFGLFRDLCVYLVGVCSSVSHWLLGSSGARSITFLMTDWLRCFKKLLFLSLSFCFSLSAVILQTHCLLIVISQISQKPILIGKEEGDTVRHHSVSSYFTFLRNNDSFHLFNSQS